MIFPHKKLLVYNKQVPFLFLVFFMCKDLPVPFSVNCKYDEIIAHRYLTWLFLCGFSASFHVCCLGLSPCCESRQIEQQNKGVVWVAKGVLLPFVVEIILGHCGKIPNSSQPVKIVTLPDAKIAPDKLPSQKESSLPTLHVQWLC